ncbi:hypothetical protein AC477_01345 [miscellaneous Crenarchaeota group-1 archaeon SG8-32-1]|uniref:YdhG-like domain-containing protein n=1 Tax=miscellaneous Crenarchaeota group-1 archaeon SG8-32-1 TaxID=1685124 RepID=A0A0M0BZP7_9ARCH|nr:MAG: hypothetical protein AC477_01345 [miscellaneous Crenarchaeota group-1 archaeon SG8-32-1]
MDKSKIQFKTIDDYIAPFPKNVRNILKELRLAIKETAPKVEETISYGIPTFDLNGRHLVHFAAYKNHIGFYPTQSGIQTFKNDLSSFKTSTGTIQFPLNKPIPFDLIKKIVKFRVKETESRKE